jgi:two-component system NtrC family sensor kinase
VTSRWLASWRRNRLFRKYVGPFVGVVLLALLSNGLLEIYFAYQENKSALAQIQREKAAAAAVRIEAFVKDIERQMGWTTQPQLAVAGALEQRRLDYFRLQRQVPAITEVSYLDARGREQLRISRLAMDVIDSGIDLSSAPRFTETRGGATWYGPVYFRKDSEPYMAIAIPHGKGGGVTAAEVNLKFILDVVSQIRIGKFGHAYVVDAGGQLIAHPDISLVLKKTDLSELPQIRAARAAPAATPEGWPMGINPTRN